MSKALKSGFTEGKCQNYEDKTVAHVELGRSIRKLLILLN